MSSPMKTVCDLGAGRFQLLCHCLTEFTFLPEEGVNANSSGQAICPTCQCVWDQAVTPTMRIEKLFRLSIRFCDDKTNKRYNIYALGTYLTVAIGVGYDLTHFASKMLGQIDDINDIGSIVVQEITLEEAEADRREIARRNRQEESDGVRRLIDVLLK